MYQSLKYSPRVIVPSAVPDWAEAEPASEDAELPLSLDCVELAVELALVEEGAGLASPLDWDELAPEEAPELQAASKKVKIRAPTRRANDFIELGFVFVMAISSECSIRLQDG